MLCQAGRGNAPASPTLLLNQPEQLICQYLPCPPSSKAAQ